MQNLQVSWWWLCFPHNLHINQSDSLQQDWYFRDNSQQRLDARKLFRTQPVSGYLTQTIRSVYSPQKQMSFDETMIAWRGHLKFRIYNSEKITQYGMLIRMVCEGKSGYICNTEIHAVLVHTVRVNTTNVSDWHHLQLKLFGSGTILLNFNDSW